MSNSGYLSHIPSVVCAPAVSVILHITSGAHKKNYYRQLRCYYPAGAVLAQSRAGVLRTAAGTAAQCLCRCPVSCLGNHFRLSLAGVRLSLKRPAGKKLCIALRRVFWHLAGACPLRFFGHIPTVLFYRRHYTALTGYVLRVVVNINAKTCVCA